MSIPGYPSDQVIDRSDDYVYFSNKSAVKVVSEKNKETYLREVQMLKFLANTKVALPLSKTGNFTFSSGRKVRYFVSPKKTALSEWISTSYNPNVIKGLFKDICSLVSILHALELYHNDIKPGNIVLDENITPHLIDFGFSGSLIARKEFATRAIAMKMCGTPKFMSKECYDGSDEPSNPTLTRLSYDSSGIDKRDRDVFALGCLYFFMLTRTNYYEGDGFAKIKEAVISDRHTQFPSYISDADRLLIENMTTQKIKIDQVVAAL